MDTAPLEHPSSAAAAADKAAGARLRLHIPPHHPAPGEPPDLGYVPRFAAGALARPEISVPAQQTHPLADKLIRVLDDEDAAVGAWDPKLPAETLRRGLRAMTTACSGCSARARSRST
jgi:hypothetical protein